MATLWLSSPGEAARWAGELASATMGLPKMASLNRRQRQMDTIRSVQALWEVNLVMAQNSSTEQDTLRDEVAEDEQEMNKLNSEVDSLKLLSLDSHKIERLDVHAPEKEGKGLADPTQPVTFLRGVPKIEGLKELSIDKEGQMALPQGQLDVVWASPMADVPKSPRLDRRRAHDLIRQTAEGEVELAAVRQQVLSKRAQELLKPSVVFSALPPSPRPDAARKGGRAVVKEMVTRPFDTIPEDHVFLGPLNPPSALPTLAVLDA